MKLILNEDLFQDVPSGPEEGVETTIADMLITAINDEWKTIQYYNSLISALKQAGQEEMIPVIEDINNEEHKHVGQLQECLKQISPNTMSIADGETEGSQQIDGERHENDVLFTESLEEDKEEKDLPKQGKIMKFI